MISWFSYGLTDIPQFSHRVIDTTKTLTDSQKNALEASLIDFEKTRSDGAQIAVLMITKLDNETVEHYANRVFNQWGIGKKGQDNGILLLIVKDDKQMRIEVGYGLEGIVTDLVASRIIREQLAPQFKQNDYYQGIIDAISVLKGVIIGNDVNLERQTQNNHRIGLSDMLDMMFNWIIQQSWKVFSFFVCLVFTVKFEKNVFKRTIITSLSNSLFILIVIWCVHGFSYLYMTDVVFILGINYVFANLLFIAISSKKGITRISSRSGSSSRSSYSHSSRSSLGGGGGRSGGGGASGSW
ncbi:MULTISPECIES: YgcG family protein [unclassified Gilliamella]|uniref:TPM domain-containing protein n=1 Tax=unclassified Gilliamella TaxID=2685620 RepID=UPI001305D78C|nr:MULTISPECIES: TPM domain-containing protein [unclassified Gilliamella]MWP49700.1 hypothetical protein [Gilliamella sp. Lep-s35]MWP69464.1 hypothetical protein [Gilliamella sp. Lep-s5]MWP77728.1 hypothetical protein [Gilliamella sp. Lep-s21]